ncbi:MAG: hypothetical protein IJG40_03350 [Oscillospiraceae bacterium]|nr:hypothetical protein [Oscillospiraceae bacterium]
MRRNLNRLVNLGLLLLGTFSQLTLFLNTVGCKVSAQFPLWVILLCLLAWFVVHAKHGILIGLPVFGLMAAGTARYLLPDLKIQFQDLCDRVTGVFYETVLYRGRSYPYLNAVQDHTILFLIIAFLIAGYIAMALSSQGARTSLVLIGTLPLFAICIMVNETPPALAVAGGVLFLFLTAVGGSFYWEGSGSFSAALGTAIPLAVLFGLLLLYINPQEYVYEPPKMDFRDEIRDGLKAAEQWAEDLVEKQDFTIPEFLTAPQPDSGSEQPREKEPSSAEELSDAGTIPAGSSAASLVWQSMEGTLDLTQKADSAELDKVFLRVKADGSGRLYLRGSSFGDYTGTGWKASVDEAGYSSLAFTANALAAVGGEEQMLSVRDFSSSAYRFLPYFSREEKGIDSYVPSDGSSRYDAAYISIPSLSDISAMPTPDENEVAYRSYAQSVYTRLPDSTRNTLRSLLAQAGINPGDENLIGEIAAYVQSAGEYDLSTPAYPSDDYAVYFLTEAHRGYCIHFATAAAAAFRSLGVPARVTAGFVTETVAGRYTDVTGSDAHAWVEIYQNGVGWIPVEVTGQSGIDGGIPGAEESSSESSGEEPNPEESAGEAENAEPGEEGTVTQAEASPQGTEGQDVSFGEEIAPADVTPAPEAEPTPQLPVGMVTQPVPEPDTAALQQQAKVRKVLILLAVFVLPPAVLLLRRAILLALRRRAVEQPDTHRAVIAVYRTAEKIARFGAEIPREIIGFAEKAAFSAHEITQEEAAASRANLHLMQHRVYSGQTRWNRFRFKYLKALI